MVTANPTEPRSTVLEESNPHPSVGKQDVGKLGDLPKDMQDLCGRD